jgi:hypothetical protein
VSMKVCRELRHEILLILDLSSIDGVNIRYVCGVKQQNLDVINCLKCFNLFRKFLWTCLTCSTVLHSYSNSSCFQFMSWKK